jgi:hypothetical protein
MADVTLTDLEVKVLKALFKSADGNGHDFGFIEDGRKAVSDPKSLGGVVASLVKKGIFTVHEPVTTNEGTRYQQTYTQFTWDAYLPDVARMIGTSVHKRHHTE